MKTLLHLLAALLIAAAAGALDRPSAPAGGVHGKISCDGCHKGDLPTDCDGCHKAAYNPHPVNMKPTMAVPPELPLSPVGLVTCATCHAVHGGKSEDSYVRNGVGHFASRRTFCYKCHTDGLAGINPHDARGGLSRCLFCHEADETGVNSKTTVNQPLAITCRFCHGISDAGHANLLGVSVAGEDREVADCAHCHDPHTTTDTIYNLKPTILAAIGRAQETSPHRGDYTDCRKCHTRTFADEIRATGEKLLQGGNIRMLCLTCHVTLRGHHPTGIALDEQRSAKLRESGLDLPFDKNGQLTCWTCHKNGCDDEKITIEMRHYDRAKLDQSLCWACHDQDEYANTDPHIDDPGACAWCHETKPIAGVKGSKGLIASPTMICLRCHPVEPHPGKTGHVGPPRQGMNVDHNLPLGEEGEITCVTCHDPHYKTIIPASRLRMARICLGCHGGRFRLEKDRASR